MNAPARTPRTPRTQQQRRDETRRALLGAAVESLIELGFARTTTLEVQRRAGVSRGALLHHFPSKAALLAATIEHLAELRGRELKDRAVALPGSAAARIDAALTLLWECFTGSLFDVTMELRGAARTDPELRAALAIAERAVRDRILQQSRVLFGAELAARPGFERALDLTLHLMIGAGMTAILHGGEARVETLIDQWKTLFPTLLGDP
ncbi:MAG: TetR/AcrR family transcriptional regulator [Myxococcales bacterium]|nr:TetR/AcrR family transcriptional regulator [Myxococcales bacterium]